MKTILTMISIILSMHIASAQATVSYAYDNNGNRTGRTIVLPKTSEEMIKESDLSSQDDFSSDEQRSILHDGLDKYALKLYPNPTSGRVMVESDAPVGKITMYLTDTKGNLLKTISSESAAQYPVTFDLSAYSSGLYYLKFVSGQDSRVWKIIKK